MVELQHPEKKRPAAGREVDDFQVDRSSFSPKETFLGTAPEGQGAAANLLGLSSVAVGGIECRISRRGVRVNVLFVSWQNLGDW